MKVLVAVNHETAKAVLCSGTVWNAEKGYYDVDTLVVNEFWLPKSQIEAVRQFYGKEFIGESMLRILEVAEWLVKKHDLKRYEWDGEIREAQVPRMAFPDSVLSEW